MAPEWYHNAVTYANLYNPEWARSVFGEHQIKDSLIQLTPENKIFFQQKAIEMKKKAATRASEAAAYAKTKLQQSKVLPTMYPDYWGFGLGPTLNNLEYLAATVPNKVKLALKVFFGLVVVFLITWIIFKSKSVKQRDTFLQQN